MSSDSKSSSSIGNLRVDIVKEQTKNKLYLYVPSSIELSPCPKPIPQLLSFSHREYYPFGLIKKDTEKLVVDTHIKCRIRVEYLPRDGPPSPEGTTETLITQNKGVYWFGAIRGHYPGTIRLSVVAERDGKEISKQIDSFSQLIEIQGDLAEEVSEDVTTIDKIVSSKNAKAVESIDEDVSEDAPSKDKKQTATGNETTKSKTKALEDVVVDNEDVQVTKRSRKSKVIDVKDESDVEPSRERVSRQDSKLAKEAHVKDESTDHNIKKSRRNRGEIIDESNEVVDVMGIPVSESKARSRRHSEGIEIDAKTSHTTRKQSLSRIESVTLPDEADVKIESTLSSKKKPPRKRVTVTMVDIADPKYQTLPYPTMNALPARVRINRPGVDEMIIQGSDITLRIPPSLVIALKDDRCRVATLQMLHPEVMLHSQSDSMEDNEESAAALHVYQAHYITENEAKPCVNELLYRLEQKVIHIPDSANTIQSMRNAFEYYFPQVILYKWEYQAISKRIQNMERRKIKFGDSFGAPFLLRFIIMLATGLSKVNSSHQETAGSSSVDIDDTIASTNSEPGIDIDEDDSIRVKSQKRRQNVQSRHTKVLRNKLQEILEVLLADLDEYAHLIFY